MQAHSCLVQKIGRTAKTTDMAPIEDDMQLVRDLLAWADTNANRVAKTIGVANTTINRFVNGTAKTRLGRETLEKLRVAYPEFPGFAMRPPLNAVPFKMEGASAERMRDDLPIYGTALGAARQIDSDTVEQTSLNTADAVQYAKRPVLLNGKTSAYGLYVAGSSMEPRHMDGETILADPQGRVRNGEDVIVYLRPTNPEEDDGASARAVLVKRLVRRTAAYIELEQYTPALVFRVPVEEVVRIDRVLPWSELLA